MAGIGRVEHNFHIQARRMFDRMAVQLYLYQKLEDGRIRVLEMEQTDHGPYLKSTDIGHPEPIVVLDSASKFKPFLVIDEPMFRELLSAMTRLADEEGVPRPSEDHLKGKLEATQAHLQDVQHMLQFATQLINRKDKHETDRIDQGARNPGDRLSELSE